MLSISRKRGSRESRKTWVWVKVCLWPDLKIGLICIRRYLFTNPSGQEPVWLGLIPGKLGTGKASKYLKTVWLQVSWHEGSTTYDKAEGTRAPLNSPTWGVFFNPNIQPHPKQIRSEFLGVGCWNALKSSPGNLDRQPGTGNPELKVGSQNCSLEGWFWLNHFLVTN